MDAIDSPMIGQRFLHLPPQERQSELSAVLRELVARAAQVSPASLARNQPLLNLGLDSLAVIEIQYEIEKELGVLIPLEEILDGIDLAGLEQLAGDGLAATGDDPAALRALPPILPAAHAERELPLAAGQLDLWLLEQVATESAPLHIAAAAQVVEPREGRRLETETLARALAALAERHPALLTTFALRAGEPVQRFRSGRPPELVEVSATAWSEDDLDRWCEREAYRPFNLITGPLLRLSIARRADGRDVLVVSIHHIVADFWSVAVLVGDLSDLYLGRRLAPLPLTYGDYLRWQAERLAGREAEPLFSYWRGELSPPPPSLALPTDRPRPNVPTYRGGVIPGALDAELSAGLAALAGRSGTTLFTTVLAAFQAFLGRTTGQRDFVVGAPAAGRNRPELARLAGYFVRLMPLRADLAGEPSFLALVEQARGRVLGALAHDLQLSTITGRLLPERDPASPFIEASFVLQKGQAETEAGLAAFAVGAPGARLELGGQPLAARRLAERWSQFPLVLRLAETGGGSLFASLQYSSDLFDATTAGRMLAHLRELLAAVVADPATPVSALPLLAAGERHQLLTEWNDSRHEEAPGSWVHEQFAQEARKRPAALAIADGTREVTYGELDQWSRRIARTLRDAGVLAEVRVGVCLDRSPELVASYLGVLRAGGAYVALDPAHPADRLRFELTDSRVPVLLIRRGAAAELAAELGIHCLFPGDLEPDGGQAEPPPAPLHPASLAYVIYTSGSTGRPKGVELCHGALANLVALERRLLDVRPGDRTTLLAGVGFDAVVLEVWAYLTAGASLHIPPETLRTNPEALRDWIAGQGITTNFLPTALAEAILDLPPRADGAPAWRAVMVGGDRLHRHPAAAEPRLLNAYGPTEATVMAACGPVPVGESESGRTGRLPTLGRPIENVRVHVLDGDGRPLPLEVPGELVVGGAGLARGYLGRPDLTAEIFVPDPFSALPGERLYRTGDLVRRSLTGEIDFLGRIDHQVKVRGQRIELGEIEAMLATHPAVADAAVLALDGRLVAFLATHAAQAGSLAEIAGTSGIAEHLRRSLPEVMVPATYVPLTALPVNRSGKVDRRALAELAPRKTGTAEPVVFQSPVEELVAGIWEEVLEHAPIGRDDNFFQLGGHSLSATRVLSRLATALGVELPARALFEHPTVRSLARAIHATRHDPTGTVLPPLVRAAPAARAPLSLAQRGLWFLDRLMPGSPAYNVFLAFRIEGAVDPAALAAALTTVAARHAVLRTRFVEMDGQPLQEILPAAAVDLPVTDLRGTVSPADAPHALRALCTEEARHAFDLSQGRLLRARLVWLRDEEHALLLNVHHIVYDGWSAGVLLSELAVHYDAVVAGRPSPLAEPPIQYADYATWQQAWPAAFLDLRLDYWRRQLAGVPLTLELPADRPRPAVQSFRGGSRELRLPAELAAALRQTARREGTTLFMLLLTGFAVLLGRYSDRDDLLIGSPVANRTRPEIEGLIGYFVNLIALRVRPAAGQTAGALLAAVRDTALAGFAHQELPFEVLVEELRPERELARNPVLQVLLSYQSGGRPAAGRSGLHLTPLPGGERTTAKFDLSVAVEELADTGTGAALSLAVEYALDLFTETTAARFLAHYGTILQALAAATAPELPLAALPLLSEAEEHQLLAEWNDSARLKSAGPWVHLRVAEQARRHPQAPAVVAGERRLTYGELDRQARRIARELVRRGVGPDRRVAVCLKRSPDLVASCLGVLYAGGAYVALDPAHPEERLRFQLADAQVAAVLTRAGALADLAMEVGVPVLLAADFAAEPATGEASEMGEQAPPALQPAHLAYVIYTSGSTGRPKGVELSHGSLANLVAYQERLAGIGAEERTTLLVGVGFDAVILETWAYLANGAALHIPSDDLRTSPEELAHWLVATGITSCFLPTALAEALLDLDWRGEWSAGAALRTVLTGGDRLHRFVPTTLPFRLINAYGPTEVTVMGAAGEVPTGGRPGQAPTLGRPLDNARLYVVPSTFPPAAQAQVPVGIPGELWIAGAGLGRGYLRRPDLTAERFVPDPFSTASGERAYRTGDLVRRSPEGEIEFLGRLDHQVKIRGFRIELGEIEAVAALHPAVREAVVLALDGNLVAFVTCRAAVTAEELRRHASRQMPDHMVPAAWVMLAEWPQNASGKVDRAELARLGRLENLAAADGWAHPIEELLAGIWRELLEVARVRPGDNFFTLGGHSLKVTQLRSRICTSFGVDLPLSSLFEEQTLRGQAEAIDRLLRQGGGESLDQLLQPITPIDPAERGGDLPLSSAQQRLWFLDQLEPGTPLYNIPLVGELQGELDVAALGESLLAIVRRHESLRTVFPETAAGAVQRIVPAERVRLPLPVVDTSALPGEVREGELDRLVRAATRRPFDLARGPLLRSTLLRAGRQEHVLLLCMHHIVSDGWSTGVMVRELSALYRGHVAGQPVELAPPAIQYADFAAWQRRWLTGDAYARQVEYWKRQLGGLAVTELPSDHPRPAVETFRGAQVPAALSLATTEALRELARSTGTTLFMVLLAAFDAIVAAATGRSDIVVGSAVANRNRRETEDVIGFFVNTLVLRTDLGGDPTFTTLLARVRETALSAYIHEDLPFEKVVEELQPQRDLSHNPLFQVMVVLQNIPLPPLDLPGLTVSSRQVNLGTVKFDFALVWWEDAGRLVGQLEYSTVLFDRTMIERLLTQYETVLARAVADPGMPLAALTGPTDAIRHQIVHEWSDSRSAFRPGRCIHQWVEEQVALTPDALALVAGDVRLNYAELNAMANRLAHYLRRRGIGPDVLVGICVDRTWSMIVGLMGVLKAGGGALALDPTYPEERLRYVIQDGGLALLLAEEKLLPLLPDTGIPRLRIDTDWPLVEGESSEDPPCLAAPDSTMYLIYTSGSTGLPKGVIFPHSAFVNLLEWQFAHSRLARVARTAQFATFGFCVSFLEIFSVLCSGGTLVMVNEEYRRDMHALWAHLVRHDIERLHLPFAALKQLADVCGEEDRLPEKLREVVTSGEQLQIGRSIRHLFSRLGSCTLTNQYGTSEIHVVTSFLLPGVPVGWPDIAPVGRPVANSEIYLLDRDMQPLGIGVLGELYAGGACLARGYLGAPAQTAAKFVPDPFSSRRGIAGARLYRTGDLARQLPDGRLEWFGRADNQVRIRGFRVELGEVETILKQHLGVRNAAVLARPGPGGEPRLVAYVVPAAGEEIPGDLRPFLKAKLPEHMVPAVYLAMSALPLNANGKLDLDAFPNPDVATAAESYVAPSGPVEEMVAHLWAKILDLPRVGAHDNFFDLGGHSLLATQVANRIRRNFAVELPLRTLFEGPTVAELARAVVALEAKPGQSERIARTFLAVVRLSAAELDKQLQESRSAQ
jgi:amino acid adenylation domain-containing protein